MTMTTRPTEIEHGHSTLELAALETIVYSDLFDFPLKPEELRRWLPIVASQCDVDELLGSETLSPLVVRRGECVVLRGRDEIVGIRAQRQATTRVLRVTAERCGRIISALPFVRLVAITGSVAAENAASGSDLDYMVITAPGRIWTVRAMMMVLVRLYGLRSITVCPNYLLSESALELPERDRYTARELLQMIPIGRSRTYELMLNSNDWWRDYLPNATPRPMASIGTPSRLRRGIEHVLRFGAFDRAERWLMQRQALPLRRKATTGEAVFDAEMCKGHFENWRTRTEGALDERMKALLETAR